VTPKLFRAQDVCDLAQLQPYVLRSWEKEFPGIGIQKSPDSPRLYRQADVDQVLHIKRLVFTEGLTLSGARRRLEEVAPRTAADADQDVAEVLDALASDARTRIAYVRDGLRSVLQMLSSAPGTVVVVDDYQLEPPGDRSGRRATVRQMTPRSKAKEPARPGHAAKPVKVAGAAKTAPSKASRPTKAFAAAKTATMKGAVKSAKGKRSRASA